MKPDDITKLKDLTAGTGAYGLRALALEAQRRDGRAYRLEPPVSRVGCKAGFGEGVFAAWGLSHVRWESVHFNDLDPVCVMSYLLYASGELRDAVTRRVWAMVPCPVCLPHVVEAALAGQERPTPQTCVSLDPSCPVCSGTGVQDARQLWERIRKAPVPGEVLEALGAWLVLQGQAVSGSPVIVDGNEWQMMRDKGNWSTVTFRSPVDADGVTRGITVQSIASRLEQLPRGVATLAETLAYYLYLQSRSYQLKPVGIKGGAWDASGYKPEHYGENEAKPHPRMDSARWTVASRLEQLPPGQWVTQGFNAEVRDRKGVKTDDAQLPRDALASRLSSLPGPGGVEVRITCQDAGLCLPEGDSRDTVVFLDPPYLGTTGYACQLARETVLATARAWQEAGALVLVHEAVGLAEELGAGWIERPAGVLRGRESTMWAGKVQREWITASRSPVWWPAGQMGMF